MTAAVGMERSPKHYRTTCVCTTRSPARHAATLLRIITETALALPSAQAGRPPPRLQPILVLVGVLFCDERNSLRCTCTSLCHLGLPSSLSSAFSTTWTMAIPNLLLIHTEVKLLPNPSDSVPMRIMIEPRGVMISAERNVALTEVIRV